MTGHPVFAGSPTHPLSGLAGEVRKRKWTRQTDRWFSGHKLLPPIGRPGSDWFLTTRTWSPDCSLSGRPGEKRQIILHKADSRPPCCRRQNIIAPASAVPNARGEIFQPSAGVIFPVRVASSIVPPAPIKWSGGRDPGPLH